MKARDVMTADVVAVPPDLKARDIARLLLDNRISAVPVVDSDGMPIGIVSEGDLIGRSEPDRASRRDWWLALLADAGSSEGDTLSVPQSKARPAREIMSSPIVTVADDTELREIVRLLEAHHIKRVPVIRDGRIVGIVSRADLLRGLVEEPEAPAPETNAGPLARAFASLDAHFLHREHASEPEAKPAEPERPAPTAARPHARWRRSMSANGPSS